MRREDARDNEVKPRHDSAIRDEAAKWRELDNKRTYPTEFVTALSVAGYLGTLIFEQYGGAGLGRAEAAEILEAIHAEGCNGAACTPKYTSWEPCCDMGRRSNLLQSARGASRLQAFGVTEPTSGSETTSLRPMVRSSRAEYSDLMRLLARTSSCEVFFDGMRIPADSLIGEEGEGFRYILDG